MSIALNTACPTCGNDLERRIDIPSSPVPALHQETRVPRKIEANLIKSILKQVEGDLAYLDYSFIKLRERIEVLVRKREALHEFYKFQTGLLSPVRVLPPEILAKIFSELPKSTAAPVFSFAPTQVNRFWRDVAISIPGLWTDMHMSLNEKRDHEIEKVETWLSRSGGLPINLTLSTWTQETTGRVHQCLVRLAQQSHRWQRVELYMPTCMIDSFLGARDCLPLLESLSIYRPSHSFMEFHRLDTFRSAPRLRTLTLSYRVSNRLMELPWKQLTRCILTGGIKCNECLAIIQISDNLLSLELGIDIGGISLPGPVIYHSNLRELILNGYGDFGDLLDHMSLPSLRVLSSSNLGPTSLSTVIQRSQSSLRRLSLSRRAIASEDLLACLALCPMLSHLELNGRSAQGVDSLVLNPLTHHIPHLGSCCLLPHLISFKVSVGSHFNYQSFINMIESRWRMHDIHCGAANHQYIDRIQEVQVCCAIDAPDADTTMPSYFYALRQLREEGLRIYATDNHGADVDLE